MNSANKNRVARSTVITLSRSLEQVFPMFQPEGEKSWTAEWNPKYIWPLDGRPQEGMVFTHDHGDGTESIWTMTLYDENDHRIEYTVVAPDSHVTQIRIRCQRADPSGTNATISYAVTPISERGLGILDHFNLGDYENRIQAWQLAIEHFFTTGEASDVH